MSDKVAEWLEQYRAKVMPQDMHPEQYGQHADELLALIQGEPVGYVQEGEIERIGETDGVPLIGINKTPTTHRHSSNYTVPLYLKAPQPEREDWTLDEIDQALYAATREWDGKNMASLSTLMMKHLLGGEDG